MAHITLTVEFDGFDYGENKARYQIKQELLGALGDMSDAALGRRVGMTWSWDARTEEIDEEYRDDWEDES